MKIILIFLVGFLGGIASGLLGVGGGVLFVPLLVLLNGYDIHVAVGTSLAVIIPTALVACIKHGRSGMIDLKTALLLAVFSILGAWLGSVISVQLDSNSLRRIFAVFLFLLSLKMFFSN